MASELEKKVDKSKWGEGPWQSEQDRYEWRHKGVPCLILRGPVGALCGYAAVDPKHPWFKKGYSECSKKKPCAKSKSDGYCNHSTGSIIEVHGGLTYAGLCKGHICHVAQPGEPDPVWWFGFDCAHSDDVCPGYADIPGMGSSELMRYGSYKDVNYVKRQVEKLAEQLIARG